MTDCDCGSDVTVATAMWVVTSLLQYSFRTQTCSTIEGTSVKESLHVNGQLSWEEYTALQVLLVLFLTLR